MKRLVPALVLLLAVPFFVRAEFTRDLYFGLRNDSEVVRLQEFLRGEGYFTYPVSTGNYFTITLDAVKRFQTANGISPIGGYFGPQSRAAANRILEARKQTEAAAPLPAQGSATTSPYQDRIVITSLSGFSTTPAGEYLILENRDKKETISISGFRVENSRGASFAIPMGHELPGFSAVARDPIRLRPGDRAVITLGKQERQMNFRENLCTGYFDELSTFSPSLNHSCPHPDPRRFFTLSDRCIRMIERTPSCRTVETELFTDSTCAGFIQEHFNYAGCVRDYRNRADFYSPRWLVWMQRDSEFFRNVVERVKLLDQEGRVVDEYSY